MQFMFENDIDNLSSTLVCSANDFNDIVLQENSTLQDGSAALQPALFTTSKEAAIYAFEQFSNYNSYELFAQSDFRMVANGEIVIGKLSIRAIKYDNENSYMEIIKLKTAGTQLIDITEAKRCFFTNNSRYDIKTKNVTKVGNTLKATYSETTWGLNSSPKADKIALYRVNNATIKSATELKVMYSTISKKISNYFFTITLDPLTSTLDYANIVYELGGDTKPSFSSVVLNVALDGNGQIDYITVNEIYTFSAVVIGNILIYPIITNTATYTLLSYNSSVSVEKPTL
jgi:hypothetical protein